MSVSIQQAAANAYAAWLRTKLPDVVVEPRWPNPDKQKPPKSITLVMAGPRRDTPIDLRLLSKTNVGAAQTTAVWQVAACVQPFQMDIWTTQELLRDDVIARLDQILHSGDASLSGVYNPMPVGFGNPVRLGDGWDAFGTIADFTFEEPDTTDEANTVGSNIYRATYSGDARFMLTVSTTTARIVTNNFLQRLSETDTPIDFP